MSFSRTGLSLLLACGLLPSIALPQRSGGFVPGQKRPPGDPVAIARGKQVYGISCRSCHGADLRGGDMGGPNLLRSQLALADRAGELIVPVIQGSLARSGMPAIPMGPEDAKAVSAYVRSVMNTIGEMGKPPSEMAPPSILVGRAAEGERFFGQKCAGCHSATGDLLGIATRLADPKILQNTWVAGVVRRGGFGTPRGTKPVVVTVTPKTGAKVEGTLVRMDAFLVTLELEDGTIRSFGRDGDVPQVDVKNPLQPHIDMLPQLTDQNMHDVTAYLVTLK
jgi:cytochrome c oxidase cbb3-type subunit 3